MRTSIGRWWSQCRTSSRRARPILATSLIVTACALPTLGGCEKYELDRRMEQLCKKDGGVRVYETVMLPPEMFNSHGYPFPPHLISGTRSLVEGDSVTTQQILAGAYRYVRTTTYLKKGDPIRGQGSLSRSIERVIRLSDNKTLGEGIQYGRSGGDFIAYAHFTSNHCPFGAAYKDVMSSVFIKGAN